MVERHLRACSGFTAVVEQGQGSWDHPSPCPEWDARGVVEHVIGFHDVLVLRPLGAKPERPKDDPVTRWSVTERALSEVLPMLANGEIEMEGVARLLPALTTEVLVHSWDLARALRIDVELDSELCRKALESARQNPSRFESTGMFSPPVALPEGVDDTAELVALLGRDPGWAPDIAT